MNLRDRFLHWLLPKFFEYRDVVINGELYLRRYFLKGRGTEEQYFLHNIRKKDEGKLYHCHPWAFSTTILMGWYDQDVVEWNGRNAEPERQYQMMGGWSGRRSASVPAIFTHRVVEVSPSTCWTLVKAGRARRIWGFYDLEKDVWTPWRTHLGKSVDHPDYPEDELPPYTISAKHLND